MLSKKSYVQNYVGKVDINRENDRTDEYLFIYTKIGQQLLSQFWNSKAIETQNFCFHNSFDCQTCPDLNYLNWSKGKKVLFLFHLLYIFMYMKKYIMEKIHNVQFQKTTLDSAGTELLYLSEILNILIYEKYLALTDHEL